MHHSHASVFVVLSLLVAVLGSWTALDLFSRTRSHIGRARLNWLGAAACAMGLSIWSMHFIAMLSFDPGSPVAYDLPLTLLSLALAVGATWGAFLAAARERAGSGTIFVAGAAMGEFPMVCLSAALSYFDSYRQAQGTANLIQGLRDFFGAHGFEIEGRGADLHGTWPSTLQLDAAKPVAN